MSLKDIRDYFNQQIIEVDADIKPWKRDVFGNNDVNKGQAQKFYNLVIGEAVPVRSGNGIWDEFSITLQLYTTSKRDIQDAFDELYDKAIQIRNNIICYIDVYFGFPKFIDIEPTLITPLEETTNDNTIKVELSFTVRKGFEFDIGETT
jgi:hypothetical protein